MTYQELGVSSTELVMDFKSKLQLCKDLEPSTHLSFFIANVDIESTFGWAINTSNKSDYDSLFD